MKNFKCYKELNKIIQTKLFSAFGFLWESKYKQKLIYSILFFFIRQANNLASIFQIKIISKN